MKVLRIKDMVKKSITDEALNFKEVIDSISTDVEYVNEEVEDAIQNILDSLVRDEEVVVESIDGVSYYKYLEGENENKINISINGYNEIQSTQRSMDLANDLLDMYDFKNTNSKKNSYLDYISGSLITRDIELKTKLQDIFKKYRIQLKEIELKNPVNILSIDDFINYINYYRILTQHQKTYERVINMNDFLKELNKIENENLKSFSIDAKKEIKNLIKDMESVLPKDNRSLIKLKSNLSREETLWLDDVYAYLYRLEDIVGGIDV